MSSVNKVTLIGRVGKDPELKYAKSGIAMVNLTLATSTKRKVSGDLIEETQWHRLTAFDKTAEVIGQYIRKGSLIYIEGSLKYGEYTDKNGAKVNTTEIVVGQMQMLGGRQEPQEERRNNENQSQQNQGSFDDSDDVPF